ncbi:MAG: AIDA repeat-containing protein, partial [Lentisphaeria bacterium]|nr:AIDA repeat-containing protein [Lentisphaeria bacterium]
MAIVNDIIVGAHETYLVESNTILNDAVASGYAAKIKVLEGGSAVRTEVKGEGALIVSGGGSAISANINGTYAEMELLAHGVADNTLVKNGGILHISAGGSALNVNIDKTGTMSGNYNSNTYVTGTSQGKTVRFADGVASNITVYAHRYMDVDSKWTAYDTVVSGYAAKQNVLEGGKAVRTEVKGEGALIVYSGGSA